MRTTLWAEFALLGVVSGVVAAIGAEVALAMLQTKVFDFPWTPDWRLWVMLPLCGALLLSLCGGWLGLRLLKAKPCFASSVSDWMETSSGKRLVTLRLPGPKGKRSLLIYRNTGRVRRQAATRQNTSSVAK